MIRKLKAGKYRLYSCKIDPKTSKRKNLGTFDTREAAEKHERAVQYFKSKRCREKVLAFQKQLQFSICPNPKEPDACYLYKDLKFPPQVYEGIIEYHEAKAEAQGTN